MNSPKSALSQEGTPESWLPLLELAVREVFEIMLGCKLEPMVNLDATTLEFTAMVGLAGQLCGIVTMRSTAKSAVLMASKMLGIDPKEADQQTWDAMGEVANMVAGNFKNKLTGLGDKCMLATSPMA